MDILKFKRDQYDANNNNNTIFCVEREREPDVPDGKHAEQHDELGQSTPPSAPAPRNTNLTNFIHSSGLNNVHFQQLVFGYDS